MSNKTSLLRFSFHRDYNRYSGGHQKFRDYLLHTKALSGVECNLHVNNQCPVMPDFFNNISGVKYHTQYLPEQADIAFLAGLDWQAYLPLRQKNQPVINLVQHVRHADKENKLFSFLEHEALRICVSNAVKEAIEPFANGECVTIPMGHNIPQIESLKDVDLYILGKKNPRFAANIEQWAKRRNWVVHLDSGLVARQTVLNNMARSKVSLVLPNPTEGFFLPGIEAMALSDRVVVPDCIANREYCLPTTNITLCDYSEHSCIRALEYAEQRLLSPVQSIEKFRGTRLAYQYSLALEKKTYLALLVKKNIVSHATETN